MKKTDIISETDAALDQKAEDLKIITRDKRTVQLGYETTKESIPHLDGKVHHYEIHKFILPESNPKKCVGEIAIDITERNRMEKAVIIANKELAFQYVERQKRADELVIANKELAFQNEEKQKRADELVLANKELAFQNEEKQKRADELVIANIELAFQNEEKQKRADELIVVNNLLRESVEQYSALMEQSPLVDAKLRQKAEKLHRNKSPKSSSHPPEADSLKLNQDFELHQVELEMQNKELLIAKERADELVIANQELVLLYEENITQATELKAANNLLLASFEQNSLLMEHSPIAIELYDSNGILIKVNPAYLDMFGIINVSEISHFSLFDDPNISAEHKKELKLKKSIKYRAYFDFDKVKDMNLYQTSKSGQIYLDTLITPIRKGSETLKGYLVQIQDITEYKKSKEALMKSEHRSRSITSTANDAIITSTHEGIITHWNGSSEKIFGYTEDEAVGKNITIIIPQNNVEKHDNGMNSKAQGGGTHDIGKTVELSGIHKNGTEFSIDVSLSAWETSEEKYFTRRMRDTTERKRVEEVLVAANKALVLQNETALKWHATFDGMQAIIFLIDVNGKILQANKAAEIFIGDSPEGISGRFCYELVHETECFDYNCPFNKVKVSNKRESKDLQVNGKWYSVVIDPIFDENNKLSSAVHVMTDITERKNIEDKLRESELRYHNLLHKTSEGLLIMTLAGEIVEINETFAKVHGYTLDELKEKDIRDLNVLKENTMKDHAHATELMIAGEVARFEVEHYHKDGHIISFNVTANIVQIGEQQLIMSFHQDITESKKIEDKLIKSELRYHDLFHKAKEGLSIMTVDGKIVETNEAFAEMHGYELAELNQMNIRDLDVLKENSVENQTLTHDQVMAGEIMRVEVERFHKDGHILSFNVTTNLIQIGEQQFIMAFHQDITERKKSEDKLRKSEQRYYDLFHKTNEGLLIMTIHGKIYEINEAFAEMHGYTLDEMKIKNIAELNVLRENTMEIHAHNIERIMAGGVVRFEVEHYHKDGRILSQTATVSLIYIGEQPLFMAFHQDITERKQTELLIRQQNHQLKEVNATKDKLFSIIAHDLRSPFTGLLGLTEMMAEDSTEYTSTEITEFLSSLHLSIANVYKLLVNLLEWAQLQTGSISFSPKEFSLFDAFSECEKSIKQSALSKEISVVNEIPEAMKIFADDYMLKSLLRNLLTNALKFTKRGGEITAKARGVKNRMVEISITDTGIGIPKDIIPRLFIVGEDVGSKGTEDESSTGLGLLLCKEFVEMHGGKIWVESEIGKGSTFYFTLPENN